MVPTMGRRMVIAGACVLLVTLLLVTRSALAPRWDSAINTSHYVAYSDGSQLVLCARGMTGNAFLNVLDLLGVFQVTDNDVSESVYFKFESAPVPGTYSLKDSGQFVVSGCGETHAFAFQSPSALKSAWFRRTCFCPETAHRIDVASARTTAVGRRRNQHRRKAVVVRLGTTRQLRQHERFQRMLTR